jgi:hypothetical protein
VKLEGVSWIQERERAECSLRIPVILSTVSGKRIRCMALIDTGAESSLVREGLLPKADSTSRAKPVKMLGVGGEVLSGGTREATANLHFKGAAIDTGEATICTIPVFLLEAHIHEDIILSYKWLAKYQIMVDAFKHGIIVKTPEIVFVHGSPKGIHRGAIDETPNLEIPDEEILETPKLGVSQPKPVRQKIAISTNPPAPISGDIDEYQELDEDLEKWILYMEKRWRSGKEKLIMHMRQIAYRALPDLRFEDEWGEEVWDEMYEQFAKYNEDPR